MPVRQNATKRNIISFAIACATAIMAMGIQQSKEEGKLIHEQLEASVKHNNSLVVKETSVPFKLEH